MPEWVVDIAKELPALIALIWLMLLIFKFIEKKEHRVQSASEAERELWARLLQSMIKEKDERQEAMVLKLNGTLADATQRMGEVKAWIKKKEGGV